MSKFDVKKYRQLCLRLAAECRDLAADAPEGDLTALFLRMASTWTELSDQLRVLHYRMIFGPGVKGYARHSGTAVTFRLPNDFYCT